jgi:hypothetical protein
MRYFSNGWLYSLIIMAFSSSSVFAAEFAKSELPECVIQLRGEIFSGDFDKFLPVAKQLFPGSDGESTHRDTLCLNSPGGNLAEGVKFAQYFYNNGVGTVIGDGQSCVSACAIMFMMGVAKGDEVNFINRKLHIRGILGFHRPYTLIDTDELVTARALNYAYDAAFESAMNLLIIANNKTPWSNLQMMKPDLIQQMLQHKGNDLFLIDTVDKAGRFEIEIFGFDPPNLLNDEQAFYACENSFSWQYGLAKEEKKYAKLKAESNSTSSPLAKPFSTATGEIAFEVTSLDAGYSEAGCIISGAKRDLQGCGLNEATSVFLGQGACTKEDFADKSNWLNVLSVFDPSTPLISLGGASLVKTPLLPFDLRCYVFDGPTKVDDEPCTIGTNKSMEMEKKESVFIFVWPSGGKTIVVRTPDKETVNGAPATVTSRQGFGRCLLNSETKKEFCVNN